VDSSNLSFCPETDADCPDNVRRPSCPGSSGVPILVYSAVFDGHGGSNACTHAALRLHQILAREQALWKMLGELGKAPMGLIHPCIQMHDIFHYFSCCMDRLC
jgi:hypothetical protein